MSETVTSRRWNADVIKSQVAQGKLFCEESLIQDLNGKAVPRYKYIRILYFDEKHIDCE